MRRLLVVVGLLAATAAEAAPHCPDVDAPSCSDYTGSSFAISMMPTPEVGVIHVGSQSVSGFAIGMAIGYRAGPWMFRSEFSGFTSDADTTALRMGLAVRRHFFAVPTGRHTSTALYLEAGAGRENFAWRSGGTLLRSVARDDLSVGLGVTETVSILDPVRYRISLGGRFLFAPRPFEGQPQKRDFGGAGVDWGWLVSLALVGDF